MTRYHFEIVDGYKIKDPVGVECKTEQQAQQLAENIAHQIVIDVGAQAARRVVVVDDAGAEIYKAQVKDAT